jgi:hypothetical protein
MGDGQVNVPTLIREKLHDTSIQFEEYLFYAKIQREQEARGLDPAEREALRLGGPEPEIVDEKSSDKEASEKEAGQKAIAAAQNNSAEISVSEWETASRAGRNASWAAM